MVSHEHADTLYAFAFKKFSRTSDEDSVLNTVQLAENTERAPCNGHTAVPTSLPPRTSRSSMRFSPYFMKNPKNVNKESTTVRCTSPISRPRVKEETPTADTTPTVQLKPLQHRLIPHNTKVIAFDTETSGWIKHVSDSNLVIQIAWVMCSESGDVTKAHKRYCQLPRGVPITGMSRKVHRISIDTVRSRGTGTLAELERFCDLVNEAHGSGVRLVAHNASFDVGAVNRTLLRFGSKRQLNLTHFLCTMQRSGILLNLRGASGRARNPKNSELYKILYHEEPVGDLHDALVDARCTANNYLGGFRRKWWN